MSIFLEKIDIKKVRNITDRSIVIIDEKENEKKHLILTGKNGSGKTSLLTAIKQYLNGIPNKQISYIKQWKDSIRNWENRIAQLDEAIRTAIEPQKEMLKNERMQITAQMDSIGQQLRNYEALDLKIGEMQTLLTRYTAGEFIIAAFDAKRMNQVNIPSGIQKLEIKDKYNIEEHISNAFVQFIVNLKAERSFAKDENDNDSVIKIDRWFDNFENLLKTIFENNQLKLRFDRRRYNFDILLPGFEPFDLNTLSDGYSSIINIITELMIRMENKSSSVYEIPGIVLIDEIETHLHVKLQKIVLPMLTSFFPNIQFIVSTHSPFVINSIDNAVVYDLENNIQIDNLSNYSYSAIIEGYLGQDQYSDILKGKIELYKELKNKDNKTQEEMDSLDRMKKDILSLSKYHAPHIEAEIQNIMLEE